MSSLVEERCRRGSMNAIARAISKCGSFSRGISLSSSSEKSTKPDSNNSNSSLDSLSTENDVFCHKIEERDSEINSTTLHYSLKKSDQSILSKQRILFKHNQFLVEGVVENDEEHNDWVIVNSIPRFQPRSFPDLNENATSSNKLSRSCTEVWWNIRKLRSFLEKNQKTSDVSHVSFTIGKEKILKNTNSTQSQINNETNNISDLQNQPCSSKQNSSIDEQRWKNWMINFYDIR